MWCGCDVWLQAEGLMVWNPNLGSLSYTCESLRNTQDTFNLHLHLGHLADALSKVTYNKYICQKKEAIYRFQYSKDVHRNRCQAFTIVRLPIPKLARIRRYTMLSTIYCVPGHNTYNKCAMNVSIELEELNHQLVVNRSRVSFQWTPFITWILFLWIHRSVIRTISPHRSR